MQEAHTGLMILETKTLAAIPAHAGRILPMWHRWGLRTKIVGLTVGVVLPIMAATTTLAVRLYRSTLEDDIRNSGLALARELAASAASRTGTGGEAALQREIGSVLGRGSLVRGAAVYAVGRPGLTVRASGGQFHPPGPDDEVAAREGQEVVALRREGLDRVWRIAVPVWVEGRSVGAVSLTLPLGRAEALAKRVEHQAIFVGAATVVLLVGTLAAFMNRAMATPLGGRKQASP